MEEVSKGLTTEQAIKNQKLYGKNQIIIKHKYDKFMKFINIFGLIIIPTIISIIVYILKKEYIYSLIIFLIYALLVITKLLIGKKVKKRKENIDEIITNKYKVIRDNKEILINEEEITVDDILILKSGDKVPVDGLIIKCHNLYVKQMNEIVKKDITSINKNEVLKTNYLYANSLIIKGNATIKVSNVGNSLFCYQDKPLNKNKLFNISSIIDIILLILCIIVTIFLCIKINIYSGLLIGCSSLFSMLILNFKFLTDNYNTSCMYKLIKNKIYLKNNLIYNKSNKIRYLCLNKEKFITEGNLSVKEIFSNNIPKDELLINMILSYSTFHSDDIINAVKSYYNDKVDIENLVKKYPYDKRNNLHASVFEFEEEKHLFVSGDLESLFDICDLDVDEKYKLHNFQKDLYKKGFIVVGVASKEINEIKSDIFDYNIHFDGIIALYDFPKKNAKAFIDYYNNKNIKTLIFTNDNKTICKALGKNLKLYTDEIFDDADLNELSDDEILYKLKKIRIFSNISGENKKRLVDLLETNSLYTVTTINYESDLISFENSSIKMTPYDIDKSGLMYLSDIVLLNNEFDTIKKGLISPNKFVLSKNRLIRMLCVLSIINLFVLIALIWFNILEFSPMILLLLNFLFHLMYLIKFKK